MIWGFFTDSELAVHTSKCAPLNSELVKERTLAHFRKLLSKVKKSILPRDIGFFLFTGCSLLSTHM